MNILKNVPLFFYCWLACVLIQLPLIWWFYPDPIDFSPNTTVHGMYAYNGNGRLQATSTISGRSLFCGISYLGAEGNCGSKLAGQFVTAKLATYKHLFGEGKVLMEARAPNGDEIIYSADLRMELWRFNSGLVAVHTAFLLSLCVVYPIFKFKLYKFEFLKQGNQNSH